MAEVGSEEKPGNYYRTLLSGTCAKRWLPNANFPGDGGDPAALITTSIAGELTHTRVRMAFAGFAETLSDESRDYVFVRG